MGKCRVVPCALAVALTAPFAVAQETTTFALGQYMRCNEAKEERADAIFKETVAPLLDQQVKAGSITTYGWLRHWFGAEWRRVMYVIGPDLGKIVDARDAVISSLYKEHAEAAAELNSICSGHDDYLWTVDASSQTGENVGGNRAAVGASTYFVCDSRQEQADAIVKTALAPILNQHVKEGKITSWTWLAHAMGGKYRRALVFDGADHKTMLGYWEVLGKALDKASPDLFQAMGEICSSHTDYVWDIGTN